MDPSPLPRRLFADGEEPVGDRVNNYFNLTSLKVVIKALQPLELEKIRPVFGRLLDVYSKPSFSGKLAHFLLSRQLDIAKKHELWVIFGGKPVKFSLREFGIVTGLNCSQIPTLAPSMLKSSPGVAPYWFTLFGGEENVTGETLTNKLKKAASLTAEIRIKYACLLLVHGLLCRRSFHMKIPKDHVELIRNIDNFLEFPWGRNTFDLTMQSIKSRTVMQLAQPTVAIQGFIHALQLVLLAAVPASICAVGEATDPDSADDGTSPLSSLKLDKLWELEGEKELEVVSIITATCPEDEAGDFSWADELVDHQVDHLESAISAGTKFTRHMFVGGLRGYAVAPQIATKTLPRRKRRREVRADLKGKYRASASAAKKAKAQTRPSSVRKENRRDDLPLNKPSMADEIKAAMVESQAVLYAKLNCDMKDMEARQESKMKRIVAEFCSDYLKSKEVVGNVLKEVNDLVGSSDRPTEQRASSGNTLKPTVVDGNGSDNNSTDSRPNEESYGSDEEGDSSDPNAGRSSEVVSDEGSDSEEVAADVDSEIGVLESLTQEQSQTGESIPQVTLEPVVSAEAPHTPLELQHPPVIDQPNTGVNTTPAPTPTNEKFKDLSAKTPSTMVLPFGNGLSISVGDILNLPVSIPPSRPEVMDSCVLVLRESLFASLDFASHPRADVLTCSFVGSLATCYSKFKNASRKDRFGFDSSVIKSVRQRFQITRKQWLSHIDYLYFPFNIDKSRWVGVMVDLATSSLTVFDSNASLSRASRLKAEFEFLCAMIPYLVRKVSVNDFMKGFSTKPLSFFRDTNVAQSCDRNYSGMLSLLFIEAHACGGLSSVYSVNDSCVRPRAEQLAVEMYEHCIGDIE